MNTILAIGEEEFTLGFELVGIPGHRIEELETLLNEQNAGIVILSQQDYDKQDKRLQQRIDQSIKPIVVILSEEDIKGGHLRDAVIRALGVDVLK